MAEAFRVRVPFTDPATGKDYDRGALIAHPDRIAALRGTEREAHGHMVNLDDDHHAVQRARNEMALAAEGASEDPEQALEEAETA